MSSYSYLVTVVAGLLAIALGVLGYADAGTFSFGDPLRLVFIIAGFGALGITLNIGFKALRKLDL